MTLTSVCRTQKRSSGKFKWLRSVDRWSYLAVVETAQFSKRQWSYNDFLNFSIICEYTACLSPNEREPKWVSPSVSQALGSLLYARETWHCLILTVTLWSNCIVPVLKEMKALRFKFYQLYTTNNWPGNNSKWGLSDWNLDALTTASVSPGRWLKMQNLWETATSL